MGALAVRSECFKWHVRFTFPGYSVEGLSYNQSLVGVFNVMKNVAVSQMLKHSTLSGNRDDSM